MRCVGHLYGFKFHVIPSIIWTWLRSAQTELRTNAGSLGPRGARRSEQLTQVKFSLGSAITLALSRLPSRR